MIMYKMTSHKNLCADTAGQSELKISGSKKAINLAGNGWYSYGLLASLSLSNLAMGFDMFGFSLVVDGATCDFNLDMRQKRILLSMSFAGPIVMAYPWGYITDTQGRRKSLLVALWVSFLVSIISAFSPNWTVMAVLKFISTSFCSCVQSASYTLLGESTSQNSKDAYMLIMTSVLDFCLAAYVVIGYYILNLHFSYNWGFITFTPWRLMALTLALPLGIGALTTHFLCESPKFLINADREKEAIHILKKIWKINKGQGEEYPVIKVMLVGECNNRQQDASFIQSLWNQIVPLFKPPHLWRSLQLYICTVIVFGTSNTFFVWFPYIAGHFATGMNSITEVEDKGVCNIIVNSINASGLALDQVCTSKMEINVVWSTLIQGISFVFLMAVISKLAHKKKLLQILILSISCLSSIGAAIIKHNFISAFLVLGLLANELCIGIIYTYFVDLYPTSYRGMASCIGVMVARASALGGIHVLGALIETDCTELFYICTGLLLVSICLSFLLPPDKRKGKSCNL